MRWLKKFFYSPLGKRKPQKVYTLDQDGGLVVSLDAIARAGTMDRQLKAVRDLRLNQHRRKSDELVRELATSE